MDPQLVTLAVDAPDRSAVGPPVYANVAHVSSTPYDFRLTFSLLSTSQDGRARLVAEPPRAIAEVVFPAGAVDSLVELLREELDRFVDEFGPPRPSVQRADGNDAGNR
ncbi:MAG: DUF3467 domain-containing protein [Actinomycetota bacterium]